MAVQPDHGASLLKNWQVWPGRNRPWCRGRFLCGPDQGVLTTNVLLIVCNSTLFDVFVAPLVSPAVVAVDVLLVLFSLTSLAHVSFTEPGILPRQVPFTDEKRNSMPTPSMDFRGEQRSLRYCGTCNLWRPPRSKHCRDCDNCVLQFDHHCPWVSNCIGARNHKYFVWFLLSTCTLVCYTVFWSGFVIIRDAIDSNLLEAMAKNLVASIECILCFIFAWCLCSMCSYHLYLIANSLTTNEQMKGEATADSDNCFRNFRTVCCSPSIPSLLLLRGDAHSPEGTHKPLEHMERIYRQFEAQNAPAGEPDSVVWHEEEETEKKQDAATRLRDVVVNVTERLSPASGLEKEDFQTPLNQRSFGTSGRDSKDL